MPTRNNKINIAERLSKDLRAKLFAIKEKSAHLWSKETIHHPFYTIHGLPHSNGIIDIFNNILPKELFKKMNDESIFLLLSTVYLWFYS